MKILLNSIKYIISLVILLFSGILPVHAQTAMQTPIAGSVSFDWPLFSKEENSKIVTTYKDLLFSDIKYKVDPKEAEHYKKDVSFLDNREYMKNNVNKLPDRELAGFYLFQKLLVIYGVSYKADNSHIYYYDAFGRMVYFDILNKPNDVYPHIAYQYKNDGSLVGVSYYISAFDQYMFDAKGNYKGRWFHSELFNLKGKVIMTRVLPDDE